MPSPTQRLLERLKYPDAASRLVPHQEISELITEANQEVGNRLVDPASLILGYWEGVRDERTRTIQEFKERKRREYNEV